MRLGRYAAACEAYPSDRREAARDRLKIAQKCLALGGGRTVLQVEPIPGTKSSWIALFAKEGPNDPFLKIPKTDFKLGIFAFKGDHLIAETRSVGLPDIDVAWHGSMFLTRLQGFLAVIVTRGFPAANCAPSEQRVLLIKHGQFHTMAAFKSVGEVRLIPATGRHGFRILTTPTYKIWWPDVYEWANGSFVFANARSPDLFVKEPLADYELNYYPAWLRRASILMIQGETTSALRCLIHARLLCKKAVFYSKRKVLTSYRTYWFDGDDRLALNEINQRIGWLRQHDYNHALLYRPYDDDLQIAPYRLGHVMDELHQP